MSSAITIDRNFKNLNSPNFDLYKQINEGIKLIAKDIQNGIQAGAQFGRGFIRNAPSTIEKKGFDHPLRETGLMMDAERMIKVKATKANLVGELMPNVKRVDIGFKNQFGKGRVPARPWFGISQAAERKILTSVKEHMIKEIDRL